ncbi:MAG: hypothetical protein M1828_002379 [Chrysothrix sp. TS-e1954]|nr:MAG: hypothetical protein M1828_002379 [Chrysothrix sp. TS-e1954]
MASADTIIAALRHIESNSFKNEHKRLRARDAVHAALARIQSPWETALQHVWGEPATSACLKVCIDLEVFKKWVQQSPSPKTAAQLAQMVNADEVLITRLLRQLGVMHHIEEVGQNTLGVNRPGFDHLPDYLKNISYRNPSDPSNTNFQQSLGEPFFPFLEQNPALLQHFQNAMKVAAASGTPWTEVYPTDSIVADLRQGHALVVDVGGGQGHDLEHMRHKYPALLPGSLILQDLPGVVENASVRPPIVAAAHDFFVPNPNRGARVYYLHAVLHDWPDAKALEILRNVIASMERGYSRILLHEQVVGARHPDPRNTAADLTMMMCFSAHERSEEMWSALVRQVGLRVVKLWTSLESAESIMELDLMEEGAEA